MQYVLWDSGKAKIYTLLNLQDKLEQTKRKSSLNFEPKAVSRNEMLMEEIIPRTGRKRRTKRRAELSQHFLLAAPAASLVQATSVSSSDLVVEIGPGRGALTKPLLKLHLSTVLV